MVTLINGANVYVATKINNQGADVFTVSQKPAFTTSYKEYLKYEKRKVISMDEYRAMQKECTACAKGGGVSELDGRGRVWKAVEHRYADTRIHGVDAGHAEPERRGGARVYAGG